MASQPIPPLQIQKGARSPASPQKDRLSFTQSRPLSELSPMALRRNSPSFPRNSLSKLETSPITSSPFNNSTTSTRVFWQGRDPNSPSCENRNQQENVSPSKRSSIENLKKASRVKNSNMFARELKNNYDPTRPNILDGRPLTTSIQGNAFSAKPLSEEHNSSTSLPSSPLKQENTAQSESPEQTTIVATEVLQASTFNQIAPLSPSKLSVSPTKSSLSKKTGQKFRRMGFDPATGIWEDSDNDDEKKLPEGKYLHRHAKSVTFDQAPPQVNEYEMTTPDPSSIASGSREGSYESFDDEEEVSFERGSSFDPHDDSFDASLEDTEKTPVVLPEDWRFMSPETANTNLARYEEDVFDDDVGSPAPEARPGLTVARQHQTSVNSVDSNGQARPLPPLPPMFGESGLRQDSLSSTLERISGSHRALPSPPQAASLSTAELRHMSNGSFSLEDRLRLMTIAKDQNTKEPEVEDRLERPLRRIESKASSIRDQFQAGEGSREPTPEPAAEVDTKPVHISRDSILQQLRQGPDDISRSNSQYSQASNLDFDPDTPIPSREDPTQNFDEEYEDDSVIVKSEQEDENDLYSIPDASQLDAQDEVHSQYSQSSIQPSLVNGDAGVDTPRAPSPVHEPKHQYTSERVSLPDFMDFDHEKSFDFGLGAYMSERQSSEQPEKAVEIKDFGLPAPNLPDLAALRNKIARPFTPDKELQPPKPAYADEDVEEPGTPSSVIRHSLSKSISPEEETSNVPTTETPIMPKEMPVINIAYTEKELPAPPVIEVAEDDEVLSHSNSLEPAPKRSGARVSSLVQLDFTREEQSESLGFGLEKEFDRVVEAQKRGYLMRHNTKIVVASERVSVDEPQSPVTSDRPRDVEVSLPESNEVAPSSRKISQPTWTAEPWNSKSRRRSIRLNGEPSAVKRKPVESHAPPLPGFTSNVNEGLGAVAEDELAEEEAEEIEDGAERGRLFVKVVGAKDLQLPFPQHEKTQFALTLDNGLHCVTTAWLDLARDAPIGQEFELVVLNDLEFQLTLQMKLEEPKPQPRAESPTKAPASPTKQNVFGRLFGSPKKKKESDVRPIPEAHTVKRPVTPPSAYELVQGLVAKDGSFARAYVTLGEYEKQAYGRPATVDVKCFNEWAMEEVAVGSSRSKKGVVQLQRRPPYEIGKLELQLLYIPKPKGTKDEDMPKSMNGAIRALREAEERVKVQAEIKEFEGHLSQQGGDCPYWRRRFFRLVGPKLTAYHETTHQPRATINLAKAAKLIDDRANLAKKEVSTKGGGRRKSGFADDEEGYMFVEEGFRIRFNNGEVIDFYADSAAAKDEWMAALAQVVGKPIAVASASTKSWTDMVLKREKSCKAKVNPRKSSKELPIRPAMEHRQSHPKPAMASGALPMPARESSLPRPHGHSRTESYQSEASRSQANSPVKSRVDREERHRKTKSMWG